MATTKAKTTKKSTVKKPVTSSSAKTVAAKPTKTVNVASTTTAPTKNLLKGFFGRKYDVNENILTIFKSPRIIGAVLGEIIGTMLLTMILLTLGIFNPLYLIFGVMVITIGVFALSGANLNPAITVGMMASRRMSPIRGTLYIIAQVVGAWFGLLVVNAFKLAGGETAQELPAIGAIDDKMFWAITFVELIGAIIIGFCFARALIYKRSVFTFGAVVAGGVFVAVLLAIVLTGNYMGIQENSFVLNPAVAIMYQALPAEAPDFGTLLGDIGLALTTYAIFPMLGATIGFYLSDFAGKLSGEKASE